MDGPTITILATVGTVGVALASLILRQGARLDTRIDRIDDRIDRINERIDQSSDQINERIDRVERGQTDLRERMAKLEGLLEGLREAIAGRRAA